MSGIYVSVSKVSKSFIYCDLDSAIVLFTYKYLRSNCETFPNLFLVIDENQDGILELQSSEFIYSSKLHEEIDEVLDNCMLPLYYLADKKYCVAGLCAVLRQVRNCLSHYTYLFFFYLFCYFVKFDFASNSSLKRLEMIVACWDSVEHACLPVLNLQCGLNSVRWIC